MTTETEVPSKDKPLPDRAFANPHECTDGRRGLPYLHASRDLHPLRRGQSSVPQGLFIFARVRTHRKMSAVPVCLHGPFIPPAKTILALTWSLPNRMHANIRGCHTCMSPRIVAPEDKNNPLSNRISSSSDQIELVYVGARALSKCSNASFHVVTCIYFRCSDFPILRTHTSKQRHARTHARTYEHEQTQARARRRAQTDTQSPRNT